MSGLKRMATSSLGLGPRSALERIVMSGPRPFAPRVSAFTRPFWQALSEGRWISTQCSSCKRVSFPPRNLCRACWGRELQWTALSPRGRLYSFTRVHVAPGAFRGDTPYAIGIIDLDEGPRLMCRMMGEVTTQDLDQAVQMLVLDYQDGPLFAARVLTHSQALQ